MVCPDRPNEPPEQTHQGTLLIGELCSLVKTPTKGNLSVDRQLLGRHRSKAVIPLFPPCEKLLARKMVLGEGGFPE